MVLAARKNPMEEGDGPWTVGEGSVETGRRGKDSPSEINEQLARRKVTFRNKFALGISSFASSGPFYTTPTFHFYTFLQAL